MTSTPFELLELPDGRWCVARIASAASTLVAGSFALLETRADPAPTQPPADPVGIFPTRDAAELAIQRAVPARDVWSAWLRG
ncbi:MAG: hypothetical protein K2Y42_07890 [Hyphomicrobium sp.]|jgi:hypothetical protein|uniref:hypothetical protein n=1 Tax=Hyphomicrobium sp. TaxID=82 RepID=UPI0025BCC445|nr:hypothetical protein [Hyphomicrobium sp.]MBX9862660.1 hypothetical protein [Hyphomicrobium sp.]